LSLKANILANYAGHVYVTVINLVMVPMYLRYMGAEAYGLVGFFAMLQMWFQMLDLGLTPTMSREAARYQGGVTDVLSLRRLLRALEGIFFISGAIGATVIVIGADKISAYWLNAHTLSVSEVRRAVILMAFLVALRWVCGLYRGAISGMEKQVWLNGFNAGVATLRGLAVMPVFIFLGSTPTHFFAFQLAVSAIETLCLISKTYRLLPLDRSVRHVRWEWAPLRRVLTFSLSVGFTSSIWVLITQTDKLVLSKLLPLAEYGYFTIAVLVAGGVMLISGPVGAALQPRLTRIASSGDNAGVIRLYRNATQLVAVLCAPASMLLAFFPEQVLWAWTGNPEIAGHAAAVLLLYAIGNGVIAVSAMPYYIQFANGNMRLHVIGGALLTALLLPALVWASRRYGAVGAGWAWLCANTVFFLAWVPLIHRRFLPRLHFSWLANDIGAIVAPALIGAMLLHAFVPLPTHRWSMAFLLSCMGLSMVLLAAAGSSCVRQACRRRFSGSLIPVAEKG
jgi:O-antigen/teichoic acid export membrane protein